MNNDEQIMALKSIIMRQRKYIENLKKNIDTAIKVENETQGEVEELTAELLRIRVGLLKLYAYSFSDAPDLSYPLPYYSKNDVDNLINPKEKR